MGQSHRLPRHLAIIMDGNGRWAARRGKPRTYGHQAGTEVARRMVRAVAERGIGILTVYAFSSENWSRPHHEIQRLMNLFRRALDREMDALNENGVRLVFLGDRRGFSRTLQRGMARAEAMTADNDHLILNVAANYGGHWDLTEAARAIARDCISGELDVDAFSSEDVASRLALADQPPPDLFIRTGGEKRLSNFLPWNLAYTELHFSDVLWPDFSEQDLDRALEEFAGRERRFGGLSRPTARRA